MVERGETPQGSWLIARRRPHPLLAPLVRDAYQGYELAMHAPTARVEVPHGGIVLIVGIGPLIGIDGEDHSSFVAGLHQRPVVVTDDGHQAGIQVNLTPLGARSLLGLPMRELTALTDVVPTQLPEQLAALPDWPGRFDAFERFLLDRLADAPAPRPDVTHAWRRLEATSGGVAIGSLCDELGCSRRHLASRFGEEVGLTPKAFARVLRFERAATLLGDGISPATAAAACGYSDQPHMNRDFRELAGRPPAAWAEAVTNVQDGVGVAA